MAKASHKTGLWLIGACGGIGTTVTLGIESIRRNLAEPIGLIGHLAPLDRLALRPLNQWVIGGHEIRSTTFEASAREMHETTRVFSPEMLTKCRPWLRQCTRCLRDGTTAHCGSAISAMANRPGIPRRESARQAINRLADDIRSFSQEHRLDRVVVVNVSSTEPACLDPQGIQDASTLKKHLSDLPASSLYALAAIEAGAAYINFTPSIGISIPAIRRYADDKGIAYMGSDGKTGETLMKSVLAPMFAARNLKVLSWVGHNIFGNRDGIVLREPANKAAKKESKDHLIRKILGYAPETLVSIEYIESMADWKTAWDHIHFSGFLGTNMTMQFTWQGCDSILAAPLVIELARFAELALRDGLAGPLLHLACFFKSPIGVSEQGFDRQYEMLLQYARSAIPCRKERHE